MKRLLSVLLCLALLASFLCVTGITAGAVASDTAPLSVNAKTISQPTFRVKIPEKVEFGQISKDDGIIKRPVSVSASGISNLFANQQKLVVTVVSENGYRLLDGAKKSTLSYSLYTDDTQTPIEDGKILEIIGTEAADTNLTETVNGVAAVDTSKIKKAGTYTDILTFTLALQEVTES